MPNYRRANFEGGTYFFTVVTHQRRRFLCVEENVVFLRAAFREVMAEHPFHINAFVLLPDHLHCIWTLPEYDSNFSTRWRLIKSNFSRQCRSMYQGRVSTSRQSKGEKAVWHRRFWEHVIRDEDDYRQHVEYIHYNPVKHGEVKAPVDWPYSSFHRFVQAGVYELDWGAGEKIIFDEGIGQE